MHPLKNIFDKNKIWANKITQENKDFFKNLSKQQSPKYLWIGCSDSRVPANQIMGLMPGEVFVHRNIANLVVHSDLNCLSVIQYAVEVLKVEHIIVCGHYNCGGIKSVLEKESNGLIDNWLLHVDSVIRLNKDKLENLEFKEKFDRLCELNVIEQTKNIMSTNIIKNAKNRNQHVSIHGLIYNVDDGLLKELNINN